MTPDLLLLVLLLLATAVLVALVRAVVRAIRRDGHVETRPDPSRGWFAPLDLR